MTLTAGLAFTGSPAQAAEARCDRSESIFTGAYSGYTVQMPTSGGANINCSMSRGESGPEVAALQLALNRCYGKSLDVDGQFGPRTQSALTEVQKSRGYSSALGRYTSREGWGLKFWGFKTVWSWGCARMDGPILQ